MFVVSDVSRSGITEFIIYCMFICLLLISCFVHKFSVVLLSFFLGMNSISTLLC